jgi:hypothetical protein
VTTGSHANTGFGHSNPNGGPSGYHPSQNPSQFSNPLYQSTNQFNPAGYHPSQNLNPSQFGNPQQQQMPAGYNLGTG